MVRNNSNFNFISTDNPMLEKSKMDRDEIKRIITQGESGTLEFKERRSSNRNLAVLLSSFANSIGGTLFLGVSSKGKIRGVENPDKVVADIHNIAVSNIDPPVQLSTEVIKIYNRLIIKVNVLQSPNGPHAVEGVYYKRKGAHSCQMSRKELKNKIDYVISKSNNEPGILKNQINQLIIQNEKLYEQVKKAQSWKTKAVDYLLGAIIGGIVSLILSALI